MERLTHKARNEKDFAYGTYISLNEPHKSVANKLGQLEDIMEKYNIETTNELDECLEDTKKLKEDYKHCNNLRKLEVQINRNYHTEKYALDISVEELRKLKIPAEQKKYYYKGFDNAERQFASHIADLQQEIELYKKAYELAIENIILNIPVGKDEIQYQSWYKSYYKGFIEHAKKELEVK